MADFLFNQKEAIKKLEAFFRDEKANLNSFGNKVNQTFEAYTFAETIKWYKKNGWEINIYNPTVKKVKIFKLKFSTRGAPQNFSYVICEKGGDKCQIRHQLRVSTESYAHNKKYSANICCDVAVIKDIDLEGYLSDQSIDNKDLISFGEVKHMSAYAELIASFIGIVHELQSKRLKKIRIKSFSNNQHISPYLNVSGHLYGTAKGLAETIKKRKYDIDIYHYENKINV